MATFEFIEWLLDWLYENKSFEFIWDKGNQEKNKVKHNVETREIEEVFEERAAIPLGLQISPKVSEDRLGIIGPTKNGRILQIVFVLRGKKVRPISARVAHKKEREQYEKILRKTFKNV